MANGNTAPSRLGQINGAGSELALFLKVFAGEVLASFTDKTVMMGRHRVKNVAGGAKSAQFPAIGTATAQYHVVGENILDGANSYLQTINHAERTIHIDEILTSNVFVSDIDEIMNHYETRAEYAKQLGIALANKSDKQIMQVLALAAAASATVSGGDGGGNINGGATLETDPALLADAIFQAQSILDQKNVPAEERYCLVTPDMYWRTARMGGVYGGGANGAPVELIDKDMSANNGDVAGGQIVQIGGVKLVPSNIWDTIDNTNIADNDPGERGNGGSDYDVNLTNVRAIVWQKQAVGTVKTRSLSVQTEYQLSHLGSLMVAKQLMGHGILRPECVVTLKDL